MWVRRREVDEGRRWLLEKEREEGELPSLPSAESADDFGRWGKLCLAAFSYIIAKSPLSFASSASSPEYQP